MKISVDDVELFTLTALQKQILADHVAVSELEDELKRRLKWVCTHFVEQCMKDLRTNWTPRLKGLSVENAPTDDDAFATVVFARGEYKDRETRDAS